MRRDLPSDAPLQAFSDEELESILSACRLRECVTGDTIVAEGAPGESMYFVINGRVEAQVHSGSTVRSYGPGSYFGELSLLNPGHRRSANVIAVEATRLQELDQRGVQSLISTHPNAILTLLRRTCSFLVEAERALVIDLRRQNDALQETIKRLDFTRRRLSEEEETARTDALTTLFNRRAFDTELPTFMERAGALGNGLALIAIDLDHFKPVNDKLGHAAGDLVLREVGKILAKGVRKSDLPCRIGGDEFMVLLADLSEEAARNRAETLRLAIGSFPHPGNEQGIRITTTMGGTLYRSGETVEQLMHRADEALYAAKRAGRNQVGWR